MPAGGKEQGRCYWQFPSLLCKGGDNPQLIPASPHRGRDTKPGKWYKSMGSLQSHPPLQSLLMGRLYSRTGMCTENTANRWCCGFQGLARVSEHCTGQRLRRKVLNSCLGFPVPSLGFLSSHCHSKKANVSLSSSRRWDPKHSDDAGSQGMWMTPWKCKCQGGVNRLPSPVQETHYCFFWAPFLHQRSQTVLVCLRFFAMGMWEG